jgi:uncharacterized protein YcfJ
VFSEGLGCGSLNVISARSIDAVGRLDVSMSEKKIAVGAVAGAILGRILGDGDAAVVGGIVGAAAGTAAVLQSKGKEVELPAGTQLTLEFDQVVSSSARYGPVVR